VSGNDPLDERLAADVVEFLGVVESLVAGSDSFWTALNWTETRSIVNLAWDAGRLRLAADVAAEWAIHDPERYLSDWREEVEAVIALTEAALAVRGEDLYWQSYPLCEYVALRTGN